MTKKIIITEKEKEHYVLADKRDFEILDKIHKIEEFDDLSENERFLLLFIRSQLEKDWRKPLIDVLDEFIKNKKLPAGKRWEKAKKKLK